jgi:hypothetical protein
MFKLEWNHRRSNTRRKLQWCFAFVLHVKHTSLNQATSSNYDEIDVHTSYVLMVLRHRNGAYLSSVIQRSIFSTNSKAQFFWYTMKHESNQPYFHLRWLFATAGELTITEQQNRHSNGNSDIFIIWTQYLKVIHPRLQLLFHCPVEVKSIRLDNKFILV